MSRAHPIISITGSSGAGTTSVKKTFEQIFRREKVSAAYIEGDAFHRYNRAEMRARMSEQGERGNMYFLYINGQFLEGGGRKVQDVFNPATDEVIGKLPHAGQADLDLALMSAQ